MREWLILKIAQFIQWLLGAKKRAEAAMAPGDELAPCPICGEMWEKGAIFCYHCGFEQKDEMLPLHPSPVRTGSLTDPDGVLDEKDRAELEGKFAGIGKSRSWDVAMFVLTDRLSGKLGPMAEDGRNEQLDGLAYCLYNTWLMGRDTGLKGLLIVVDPKSARRAMVLGRNGPRIAGSDFRKWYGEFTPPNDVDTSKSSNLIAAELDYIAGRL
jgi:hypothetical protein